MTAKVTNQESKFLENVRLNAMATDHSGDNLGYANDTHEIAGQESREFEFSFSDVACGEVASVGFNSPDGIVRPKNGVLSSFELEPPDPIEN